MSFLEKHHPLFRTPGDGEPNIAYFVARSGGEGERWAEEYTRAENVEIMSGTRRALEALRARRIEQGRRELQEVEAILHLTANTTNRDVLHVLGLWFYGTLAYYLYCIEDYRGAEEALDRKHGEIQQAIESRRSLVPYATECYDVCRQRARVARSQRLWPEVKRRLEIARQVLSGERPLCVLSDGTAVDLAAIQGFYSGLEPLTERERQPLRWILDEAERSRHLRSLFAEVYAPRVHHPVRSRPTVGRSAGTDRGEWQGRLRRLAHGHQSAGRNAWQRVFEWKPVDPLIEREVLPWSDFNVVEDAGPRHVHVLRPPARHEEHLGAASRAEGSPRGFGVLIPGEVLTPGELKLFPPD